MMEIDNIARVIQTECDRYMSQNIGVILAQLEANKRLLDNDYTNITVNGLDNKSWGIYVFYIIPQKSIPTFQDLKLLWETDMNDNKLKSPAAIQGRFKPIEPGQSTCFYVGKSENLVNRIGQHIHQRTNPSTYGLKLSAHNRLHLDNKFAYSYFVLKVEPAQEIKDGMRCLLVTLERYLRNNLTPLIGKQ